MLAPLPLDRPFLANGIPRCGTHLLMAALRSTGLQWKSSFKPKRFPGRDAPKFLLNPMREFQKRGFCESPEVFILGHITWPFDDMEQILIIRDPRAAIVACSRAVPRWANRLDQSMQFYGDAGSRTRKGTNFVTVFRAFEPWLEAGRVVRFEDLERGLVGDLEHWIGRTPERSKYWGASPSYIPDRPHWRDAFTDEDWSLFKRLGGEQLVHDWGYT